MKKFLLAVIFFVMSGQGVHAALVDWSTTPITVGDKIYQYLNSSPNMFNNASVNASEAAGIHSFNFTNLAGAAVNDYLRYAIQITDPTNFFYLNRTSQNDILGNVTGGSTTTVYSDAFTTVLNATPLVGTQTGATYTTSGLQTIYVQTVITGVDGATNQIQNVTFDVTQSNAVVPEPSTYALFSLGLGGLALWKRRQKKA
jgi:hypothetical protein